MTYITIKGLEKTFFPNTNREHKALRGITLTIEKGDFITIVGGNGAGKSTLLNALAGSLPVDKGQIIMQETNMTKLPEHKRAKFISRVFQNPLQGTAPRMTVAENMSLALRRGKFRGLKQGSSLNERQQFQDLLAKLDLDLEGRLDAEMGLLSGGQRQAIALLMATMIEPKLLLLDEHTAALDPKTQMKIMKLSQDTIEQSHLTSFMITHNLQDAIQYGNRMIVMQQGQIVADYQGEAKQKMTVHQLFDAMNSLEYH